MDSQVAANETLLGLLCFAGSPPTARIGRALLYLATDPAFRDKEEIKPGDIFLVVLGPQVKLDSRPEAGTRPEVGSRPIEHVHGPVTDAQIYERLRSKRHLVPNLADVIPNLSDRKFQLHIQPELEKWLKDLI